MADSSDARDDGDERSAIEALHARDQEATRTLDVEALLSLWTEDGIGVGPAGAMVRGRAAMAEGMRRSAEASSGQEIVSYEQRFEEVRIAGDWAWDLGTFESVTRDPDTGETTRMRGPMLRILVRGEDGRWRFHRSMWGLAKES